jgi:hypothetical protein
LEIAPWDELFLSPKIGVAFCEKVMFLKKCSRCSVIAQRHCHFVVCHVKFSCGRKVLNIDYQYKYFLPGKNTPLATGFFPVQRIDMGRYFVLSFHAPRKRITHEKLLTYHYENIFLPL